MEYPHTMVQYVVIDIVNAGKVYSTCRFTSRKLKSDRLEYGKVLRIRFDMGGATMATVDSTICATSEAA